LAATKQLSIEHATAEFRERLAFSELALTGLLRDPDLDALARDHMTAHPQAPNLVLTGNGERALTVHPMAVPGLVGFPGVDTHGLNGPLVSFAGNGLTKMSEVHALIGKRLLEAAGMPDAPVNAETRAQARSAIQARTQAVSTALKNAAQDPDVKLLLAHSESLAVGLQPNQIALLETHPSALATNESGMLTVKVGELRYLPTKSVKELTTRQPEGSPELELQSDGAPLFGNQNWNTFPAGVEALTLLGANSAEEVPQAIARKLLQRARMADASPTQRNLAKARKVLSNEILQRKNLDALINGNHSDVKLLAASLPKSNQSGTVRSVALASPHGKPLTLVNTGTRVYFLLGEEGASVANLHAVGIDTPAHLLKIIEDTMIRVASGP
jgi:hypothetical protein